MAVEALRKGAVDFIEKPAGGQLLLDKVHEAIRTGIRWQESKARRRAVDAKLALLSPREKEILGHVTKGRSAKAVARELGLSRKTIDWHLVTIREKMEVCSVSELLLLLHQAGRLQTGE